MKIKDIHSRQILDSRGNPTLECTLVMSDDFLVRTSVPAGASVGTWEAKELRDNDPAVFQGKGVMKAIKALDTQIAPLLVGKSPDLLAMDQAMIQLDGTEDKSHLGANTLLAVSMAIAHAQAHQQNVELYQFINELYGQAKPALPLCMFNLINGGAHADSGLAFQEFMVIPQTSSAKTSVQLASSIDHELKKILQAQHYGTGTGDEGGFAPMFKETGLKKEYAALDLLLKAVASCQTATPIDLCLDVAASQFFDLNDSQYHPHGLTLTAGQMISLYQNLTREYPIVSIEDGLAQDDWVDWQLMTQKLKGTVELVGDDLFVTNTKRILQGIEKQVATAVLIKPNQIGTISETLEAITLCKKNGYKIVVSHRSGETDDSFIADLAVGVAAHYFKAGAPVHGERVAKYNRLMEIEEKLNA